MYKEDRTWEIYMDTLPSRGKLYSPNARIYADTLTIADIKHLSFLNDGNALDINNDILRSCLTLENLTLDEIAIGDRLYICFFLRSNSFIKNNGFTLNIPQCMNPHCKAPFTANISLADFDIKNLGEFRQKIHLDDANIDIPLRIPRVKDLAFINDDGDTQEIVRSIDSDDKESALTIVQHISACDYANLLQAVKENDCGIKNECIVKCPFCGHEHHFKISFDEEGLFVHTEIDQIIEIILKISKYTKFNYTDNYPWWEVEIAQDIMNKMVKEENDANKKELDKAKGQYTMTNPSLSKSGMKQSLPSMPNFHFK